MWQFIIANLITMAIYKNPGARDDQQDLINQPTDCCVNSLIILNLYTPTSV